MRDWPDTFLGFRRESGPAGVRNHLLILSVCGLNAPQGRKLAAALPQAVLVSSDFGRGQVGADKALHRRMLSAFAAHPNVGGVIVLAPDAGLRAEYEHAARDAGRLAAGFSLQEEGEDAEAMLRAAIAAGREISARLARQPREMVPTADLVLAVECGHSDASSGIVANPLAGDVVDALVRSGGKAIISETLEWTGAEEGLYARCANQDIRTRLRHLIEARHAIAQTAGHDVALGNPGPQNHAGGLTTLEEKSLGAVSKGGTGPIMDALEQGEPPKGAAGLYLMDTPTLSPESISSMVAGGAQMVIFTTGQGNPYGSAIAPTIKVTANPETAQRLPRQIDFDASPGFTGAMPRSTLSERLIAFCAAVADGRVTQAEALDEGSEVISRLGPSI